MPQTPLNQYVCSFRVIIVAKKQFLYVDKRLDKASSANLTNNFFSLVRSVGTGTGTPENLHQIEAFLGINVHKL